MSNKIEETLYNLKFGPKDLDSALIRCIRNYENLEELNNKNTEQQTNEEVFYISYEKFDQRINGGNKGDKIYCDNENLNLFGNNNSSNNEEVIENEDEISFKIFTETKANKNKYDCSTINQNEEQNDQKEESQTHRKNEIIIEPLKDEEENKENIITSQKESNDYKKNSNDINSNDIVINIENGNMDIISESNKNRNSIKSKEVRKPEKIFTIKKIKKKLRLKLINDKNRIQKEKGRKFKNSTAKGLHNKFSQDNIIRKFKTHLVNNYRSFINSKLIDHSKEIALINGYQCQNNEIDFNLKWLKTKLKDVFSVSVSTKANKKKIYDNKKTIEEIYKEKKEKEVIKILNKTVEEAINDYIGIKNKGNELKNLKNDVDELREKGESKDYVNKYIYVATNFEKIYLNKIPRRKINIGGKKNLK